MICLCGATGLRAQQGEADTAVILKEFITRSTRFSAFSTGVKVSSTDSLTRLMVSQNNLAQLLAANSPVFVKAYGPGQLATSSFRGAGAEHTAIVWNGINLQSSMHGQMDFSQLPAGFLDEVELHFGGNSALYGAGAVGGAVVLSNTPGFSRRFSADYTYTAGSFGLDRHWGGLAYGNSRYYIKAKGFLSQADNNYGYRDYTLPGSPVHYRQNAGFRAGGSMVECGTMINPKNEVNIRYWYNHNNSNIPPTIGMAFNRAYQLDEHHRVGADWKFSPNRKNRVITRLAYLTEWLEYEDPSTYLSGRSRARSLVAESEYYRLLGGKTTLNAGVNFQHLQANSEQYVKLAVQNRLALFASLNMRPLERLSFSVSLRQEAADGNILPFTASAGVSYEARKWLALTAHANKSFRLPTLNDLYWITGNPALLPEDGYGQEAGARMKFSGTRTLFDVRVSAFNRNVNNWIVWLPSGGTWTPQNLREVWSRGAELNYKLSRIAGKWMISLRGEFSHVLSTNRKSIAANDQSAGRQLIYIPRLTQQHWISVTWKKLYLAYNHTYTGYRFISTDNSAYLDDYFLGNLFAGYGFRYKKTGFDVRVQYNNIFNARYEVLPARPMPMSNYQLTLSVKFNS